MTSRPEAPGSDELEELRRRIRELERELELRNEFIAAVGHELRNPISPVLLHVQRLKTAVAKAPEGQLAASWLGPQLDSFEQRLRKLLSALNRMLDVSRMSAGQIDLLLEPVDLAEVVRETVGSFERELAAANCSLELQAPGPVIGNWDRLRLEQVVSNLVSNAIRYGSGGLIQVELSADDQRAELCVRDHGIGIDPADHARIFERFERLHTESYRGGFGVGLWLVRKLCDALGGTVSVDSELGEGAAFSVTLPRQPTESSDD